MTGPMSASAFPLVNARKGIIGIQHAVQRSVCYNVDAVSAPMLHVKRDLSSMIYPSAYCSPILLPYFRFTVKALVGEHATYCLGMKLY